MVSTDFRLGEFVVQPQADRLLATDGTRRLDLEPRTMAVLVVLAEHSGEVVSSEELVHLVWHDRPMGGNPVYKAVAKLRRALADETARPRYIETIPRKGYRLLVAPMPVEGLTPAGPGMQRTLPPPVPGPAGWAPPKPLVRLAVTFLLVVTVMVLMGAPGSGGHAPVDCSSSVDSDGRTARAPAFRGFDSGQVAEAAGLDAGRLPTLEASFRVAVVRPPDR